MHAAHMLAPAHQSCSQIARLDGITFQPRMPPLHHSFNNPLCNHHCPSCLPAGTCSSSQRHPGGARGRTRSVRSQREPLETCTPRSSPQRPTRKQWRPRGEWGVVCVWAGWCAACVLGMARTGCVHMPPLLQRTDGLQGSGPAFRSSPQRPAPCNLLLKILQPTPTCCSFCNNLFTPRPPLLCSVQPEGPHKAADLLDADGLPHVGAAIWPGQQYYSAVDQLKGGRGRGVSLV